MPICLHIAALTEVMAGRGTRAGKSLLCLWGDALSSSRRCVWEEQVWRRAGCIRRVSPCAEGDMGLFPCPRVASHPCWLVPGLFTALPKAAAVTTRCCS